MKNKLVERKILIYIFRGKDFGFHKSVSNYEEKKINGNHYRQWCSGTVNVGNFLRLSLFRVEKILRVLNRL